MGVWVDPKNLSRAQSIDQNMDVGLITHTSTHNTLTGRSGSTLNNFKLRAEGLGLGTPHNPPAKRNSFVLGFKLVF